MHYRIQAICRVPNALGKEPSVKNPSAKNSLPSAFYRAFGKVCAECPTLGKVGTEKKPEKLGKKWKKRKKKFNRWRPPPASARPSPAFSRKIHSNAVDGIQTRDLPLLVNLLYHYTILSLVSGFRFSSQHIILNRV